MPELGRDTLKRLAQTTGFPRVTIHTRMVRAGREVRQNRILLENAAATARERLLALGVSSQEADDLLRPVARLAADESAMEQQRDALSLFVDDAGYEAIQTPLELESRVEVGSRYSIAPLIEPAVNNEPYALLALSLGGAYLSECTRFTAQQVDLQGLPEDLCYVLRYDQFEKSGHVHTTSARGDAMHHGHGLGKDEHDAFVKRFVDAVHPVVTKWLSARRIPLVVVGSEAVAGRYLQEQHYADVVPESRHVDPHAVSLERLMELGWECMSPRYARSRADAVQRFHAARHKAVDIYGVLAGLEEGRVQTLFVRNGQEIRGSFDPTTESVHVDPDPEKVTENLVDTALARALELDVPVVVVDTEIETPAAILH